MASLDTPTLRRLAVQSSTDPRTVAKVARGEHVRGDAARRAAEALTSAGFPVPRNDRPHAEGGEG